MKKNLHLGFSLIILMAMAQWAHSQIVTVTPANATGWDEITLTLDANQACVPDGKQPVTSASEVRMHSAAFLYNNIDNWESAWGDPGIDYDAQPKEEGFDFPTLTDNGDGTYSITFTPGIFYGVEEGSTIIGITAVFNGGSWDFEAKDNADDGCGDFYISLSYDPPTPALKFKLDLTYQEELGNFDRATGKAYVIVNDTEYEMDQLLIGIVPDARYEKVLTEADDGITAETSYSYKFKMDDTEETVQRDPVVAKNYQITKNHFFEDLGKPVGDIKFIVDMKYVAREGLFDPAADFVDIAGSLNGWDGTDYHLTDDNGDSLYEITVEELDLMMIVEYKYRINGSWDDDKSEFPGGGPARHATVIEGGRDAKSVWNNYIPGRVPVTLSVNMKNEILKGTFVPKQNYVDVAGSLNGWGGDWNDELIDKEGDSIYVTYPAAFAPIGGSDTMQYKFRIDSSWDDDKHEFPDGGPARKFLVLDTLGGVVNAPEVVWFNDVALGIDQQPILFQEVSFYPNPVSDIMYIDNKVDMQEIRINNILGQQVVRMRLDNSRSYQLNTSELVKGIYILSVYGEKGYIGTAKFIKQ
ncbi:MAG: T9SS type A sorting domain-containing protein [Bacteroidales bacterium]|nr:T9SS type A sorting domain-containing protein [Bacteroidales bacterium]